jgi:hypothetical protein
MRDRKNTEAFQGHPRYHRLDVEFDQDEPMLGDANIMSDLRLKVQETNSTSRVIDNIAFYMVALLFYFELDSKPGRYGDKFVGTGCIQCQIRRHNPAFSLLLHQLVNTSTIFCLNGSPVPGTIGDDLSREHDFASLTSAQTTWRSTAGQGCACFVSQLPPGRIQGRLDQE